MLKKLFALILSFFALFCLCGCQKNTTFSSRVSENLNRLYAGENDGYLLSAAAGLREEPYLADGTVGTVIPFFRIKVVPKDSWSAGEDFSLTILVGEEAYTEKLAVSPLGDYLSCNIAAQCPAGEAVTDHARCGRGLLKDKGSFSPCRHGFHRSWGYGRRSRQVFRRAVC